MDVPNDFTVHGMAQGPVWLKRQAEFDFPLCEEGTSEGMTLELHKGLETWHVLRETGIIGGTVPFTDNPVNGRRSK